VYADADFAGYARAVRSTTGVALAVEGPNARMIANGVSKRQTAVSHSTPEAEIVAVDYAIRRWNVWRRAQALPPVHAGGVSNPSSKRRDESRLTK
jgi:hypothetical protein